MTQMGPLLRERQEENGAETFADPGGAETPLLKHRNLLLCLLHGGALVTLVVGINNYGLIKDSYGPDNCSMDSRDEICIKLDT